MFKLFAKKNPRYIHWQIAYREKGRDKFIPVSNPPYAWAADPFLVEFQGRIFLFAELFLYKSERNGVIGYCEYTGDGFGDWAISMDEHWHLSYPNVFVKGDRLFMCPESYQKNEVGVYELKELPDKWVQREVLFNNVKYVDTTFLELEGKEYLFTFEPSFICNGGKLLMYTKDAIGEWTNKEVLTEDKRFARPGGNFLHGDDGVYRVAQDCTESYGDALSICKVDEMMPSYKEHLVKQMTKDDVLIDTNVKVLGIHTYNRIKNLEVIDFKYYKPTIAEWIASKRTKKVFLNKYGR